MSLFFSRFLLGASALFLSQALCLRAASPSPRVVFVDDALPDYQLLVADLPRDAEVVVLSHASDGLQQMVRHLAGRPQVQSIHILSEGRSGALQLGNAWLDSKTLATRAVELRGIGSAVAPGGDLLLYGCKVAEGAAGTAFVRELAALARADVAASSNWTGAAQHGGDWSLEFRTGDIEARPVLDAVAAANYPHVMNTLSAGDLVVFGWSALSNTVRFVSLVDIPSGTVLKITDQGWTASSAFNGNTTGDGIVTWTLSSSVAKGTVFDLVFNGSGTVTLTDRTNATNLSADVIVSGVSVADPMVLTGDGVFIYQDNAANPYFIFGFNNSASASSGANGWNISITLSLTDSLLPDGTNSQNGLTNGTNAVGMPGSGSQQDNVQYTGPTTSASRDVWLARIANVVNWSGDNTGTLTSSISTSNGTSITVGSIPSVSSIVRAGGASATVAASTTSISYTVTFSESVTGVDSTDFSVTATGTAAGSIASVSGSGTTYTVSVDTLSGDGTVRLDLKSSGTGIKNGSNVDIATGYTSGSTYTLDHTAPSAPSTPDMTAGTDTGTSFTDNITSNTTPTFTGTAESGATVRLYDTDGTTLLGTGTATGGSWSITSSTLSAGSHTITATARDSAGNTSSASSGLSVTIDTTAPTGVGLSSTTIAATSATSTATIATLSATDGLAITYSLAVGNGTNDADNGSFTISGTSLKVGGVSLTAGTYHIYIGATDAAGNVANQAFTLTIVDAPSVTSIVRAGGASAAVAASTTSLSYTVTFSESVTGVDSTDFSVTSTGTASGSIASVSGSGTTYTVSVGSLSGDGTLRLDLNSSGTGIKNGSTVDIAAGYTSGSTYTLDHTAPTTTVATAGFSSDTGTSSTDFITSTASQTISGTLSANVATGETVQVSLDNGSTWSSATTTVGQNTWSLSGQTLTASNTLKVRVTDTAGNSGTVYSQAYVLDTTAPSTTVASAAFSNDAGSSSSDFITNATSQTISGTLSANLATGETVQVSLDNGATWSNATATVGQNTWSLSGQTLSGSNTLKVRVADTAGNNGTAYSQAYVLDTTAPTTTIATAAFSSDTGTSSSDFITSTASQTISGTLSANLAVGETVELSLDNGSTWTSATATVGQNTWSLSGQTLTGSSTLKVRVTDTAGNSGTALSQAYVFDTTAPTTTIATAALSADTGSSSTDFVTRTAAQTLSGTLSANLASGETVEVSLDNGSTWTNATATVGQNTWSLAGQTLTASNTLKVRVADSAGNSGTVFSQAYVLDTTAPGAPAISAITSDTGSSSTDGITNDATLVFSGTADANSIVSLTRIGTGVIGTVTADGSGNWSVDYTGTTLSAGSHSFTAIAADLAGNTSSASSAFAVTVDTTAPAAPVITGISTDTGTSSSDGVTSDATLQFSGTAEAGSTVTLTRTGVGVIGTATANGSGNWSVDYTGTTLAAGSHSFTATATDVAGNASAASSAFAVTIDTTAPSAPALTGISTDSGSSTSDGVTNDKTLVFAGTAEASSTVTLTRVGTGAIGTATADSGGNWTFDYTGTTLADGNYSFTATAKDAAGNTSASSSAFAVKVDTAAPSAPLFTSISTDTGASAADQITSDTTLVLNGTAEANSVITVTRLGQGIIGTVTADGSGNWSYDYTGTTLGAGDHTFTATATDGAGNVSSASTAFMVTVDTATPSAPAITAISTDSGSSATDGITNDTTLTISGTAEANALVTVSRSGVGAIGTATANGSGNWSFDYTGTALPEGSYLFNATASDSAGNTSSSSADFAVTIDTTAPAAPTIAGISTDSGSSSSDGVTSDATLVFSGTAEANSTVAITRVGTGQVGTATADGSGNWSFDYTGTTLADGTYSFTAIATDKAGNASPASSAFAVTVDTAAATVTSVSVPANGAYVAGQNLDFTVNFSESITVSGTDSTLALTIGSTARTAAAQTVNASSIVYRYTVQAGDLDSDGITVGVLTRNTTTIRDTAGNDATVTLNSVGSTAGVLVDGTPPTVNGVTSATANGTLNLGAGAAIQVTFSENVTVTGTPQLTLETGATDRVVNYSSGTGTNTLTFNYTVQAGDLSADLDYTATTALALNGGTIRDSAGNDAVLTLAAPGAAGSLGAAKALVVDGVVPAVTSLVRQTPTTASISGSTVMYRVTFSEAVTGVDAADFALTATGATTAGIGAVTAVSGTVYDVAVSTIAGAGTLRLDLKSSGTGITDAAANAIATGFNTAEIYTVLPAPVINSTLTASGTYGVSFSYAITATNSPTSYSASGLPAGLALNSATGAITGTPPVGTFNIGLSAANAGGTGTATLVLTVDKAAATVAVGSATVTYDGAPHGASATTTPDGLTVTLSYNGSGTAPSNAGTYSVTATISDSNYAGSGSGSLTINQASQTITFDPPGATVGVPLTLNAVASSGLPVTFSVVSGDATISGSTLTVNAAGTVTVRASQAGNGNYRAASVDRTLANVTKLDQTISFAALPDRRASDNAFTLSATSSSGLPVTFTVVSGPALVSGGTLTLSGPPGLVTVRASQAGNATYNAAPDVTRSFTVAPVGPLVYFGTVGGNAFAASVNADGKGGTMIGTLPGTGEGFVVAFTPAADGFWTATVATFTGNSTTAAASGDAETYGNAVPSPHLAALSTPADLGTPETTAAAGVTRTFRGQVAGGALTGSIDGLGLTFSATLLPPVGPTASITGYYQSASLQTATGNIYSVVGPQNQVYVLAITPNYVGGTTGEASNAGAFKIQAPGSATISGAVDEPTTTVAGTLQLPGRPSVPFSGLASTTVRTDRLINLSSRARVGPAAGRTLITGFVIGGTEGKRVLLRAIGPALSGFGVNGSLANPRLELYNGAGVRILQNDDWTGSDTAAAMSQVGAFGLSAGSRDAALLTTLAPGAYTMHVMDGGETGVALAEIYDASTNPQGEYQRLINISSRGTVEAGEGVLVGGFVVTGNAPKKVLIRGIGPSLTPLGVAGALVDPKLTVYREQTIIAQNNDWGVPTPIDATQVAATAAEIVTAASGTGAFALSAGSKDASLIVTLAPGVYTAQVTSADGSTGVALVEIYEVAQ